MSKRHQGRALALQVLYQYESSGATLEELLSVISKWPFNEQKKSRVSKEFATEIISGLFEHIPEIDDSIANFSKNWRIERMSVVDKNILRIAVYEFLYMKDTPVKVVINEAVELAKSYGDDKSSAFVNGMLDSIAKKHTK